MRYKNQVLPIIVISQFFCTSLWFVGNAVMSNLVSTFTLNSSALGHLTSAVQVGFISGTLLFALLMIADRFSPSRVFFICAVLGAFFNAGIILDNNTFLSLLSIRFFTGFFLAGIYPVGMKIASDYFQEGLGKSLGFLVGALVLGTAFPHLLKGSVSSLPWIYLVITTSILAVLGGLLILLFVPDGPYRTVSQKTDLTAFLKVFKDEKFRSIAFGYFGHMWELYAFWAFVPVMITSYQASHPGTEINVSLMSFAVIGIGGPACVVGGYIAQYMGAKKTAQTALLFSGSCCLLSPLVFMMASKPILLGFLIFWGIVVIADSPLFSTLVATYANPSSKGTALTIVNCVGFAITIVSIQLLTALHEIISPLFVYLPLSVGPALGLIALIEKKER